MLLPELDPRCGHCQDFSPTWSAVARDACAVSDSLHVGVVDCVADSELCSHVGIEAFPTVRVFGAGLPANGQPLSHCVHGCRSSLEVLDGILDVISALSPSLPSSGELRERSLRHACSRLPHTPTGGTPTGKNADVSVLRAAPSGLRVGEAPPELALQPRPMEDVAGAVLYGLFHELLRMPLAAGSERRAAFEVSPPRSLALLSANSLSTSPWLHGYPRAPPPGLAASAR